MQCDHAFHFSHTCLPEIPIKKKFLLIVNIFEALLSVTIAARCTFMGVARRLYFSRSVWVQDIKYIFNYLY